MGYQGFQGASDPFAAQGSAGMAESDPFSAMALSSGSGHAAHGLGGAPAAVDMSSPWVQVSLVSGKVCAVCGKVCAVCGKACMC
jgi:hypothetical protein